MSDNYYEWEMLEVASVAVHVANVRCKVYEWTRGHNLCFIYPNG
jgi:hypothetical protein